MDWDNILERAVKTFVQAATTAVPALVISLDTVSDWKAAVVGFTIAGLSAVMSAVWNTVQTVLESRVL